MNKRVLVAVSGGVDSSVAALLLKQGGYDVEAVILKQVNAPTCETDSLCCSASAIEEAAAVCKQLSIQLHIKDIREGFQKTIIQPTIESFRLGKTPAPCNDCNGLVRSVVLDRLRDILGCDYFATGHYFNNTDRGILRAVDEKKDQSYMLALVKARYFTRWLSPLGHLTKSAVREIALRYGLATATNPDSQDLCFKHQIPNYTRKIYNESQFIGLNTGRPAIGQKKGFGGLRVLSVDEDTIKLTSKPIENDNCNISRINWISVPETATLDFQFRSHSPSIPGKIVDERIHLTAPTTITPGQVVAIYDGSRLLGGAYVVN